MTIGEAIAAVQTIKPTQIPRAQLVRWLDEVDRTIYRELIRTHEYGQCIMFDGHDPEGETGADTELLLAPAPYDRMYIYFLCAQIDMQNQEFDLYQNNAALYNLAYSDYAAYYARQMRQQKAPRVNAWSTLKSRKEGPPCCCQS